MAELRPNHPEFLSLLAAARTRIVLLAVAGLFGALAGWAVSHTLPKRFASTSTIMFTLQPLSEQVANLGPTSLSDGEVSSTQATNLQLVLLAESGPTGRATVAKVSGVSLADLQHDLVVTAVTGTNLVDIEASAPSASTASRLANVFANQFVESQNASTESSYRQALLVLDRQYSSLSRPQKVGALGAALQARIQSLAILSDLQAGTVQVASLAGIPSSPSSPKTKLDTLLGALLLAITCAVGLVVREHLDDRVQRSEEIVPLAGLPLLGEIPLTLSRDLNSDGHRNAERAIFDEAFQSLRARLRYFNVDHALRVVVVVSATPGEGKTLVSLNLAKAVALVGGRVLLIEGDLRRPVLRRQLGLEAAPGLADVLTGEAGLTEAARPIPLASRVDGGVTQGVVHVLAAGEVPPNPAELLESRAMAELLNEAQGAYDMIVVDTAPMGALSDAIPLVKAADGVLGVVRIAYSTRVGLARLIETLTGVGAPTIGVVANAVVGGSRPAYGYAYAFEQASGIDQPAASETDRTTVPRGD